MSKKITKKATKKKATKKKATKKKAEPRIRVIPLELDIYKRSDNSARALEKRLLEVAPRGYRLVNVIPTSTEDNMSYWGHWDLSAVFERV